MTLAGILIATLAQVAAPSGLGNVEDAPLPVHVAAFEAWPNPVPVRPMRKDFEPFAKLLEDFNYAAFQDRTFVERDLPMETESSIPLTEQYTLYVDPLTVDPGGQATLAVRVTLDDGRFADKTINAVDAETGIGPNMPLILDGLPMGDHILVVVLALRQDQQGEGEGGGEGDQQQDQEQQQAQNQDEGNEEQKPKDQNPQEEESGETQEEMQQKHEESEELNEDSEDPDRLQNLEAILDSLKELDKREQRSIKNSNLAPQGDEDWW